MKPDRIVKNLLEAEDLDQRLGVLQGQAKEAGDLLDRTGKAMERTHPKAQHPELHQRLGDLQQKRREADDLLGKARYAAAYRTALHKVGLRPTDVVQRFGGEARQFALGNQRRGKFINAVETKDGRRVKLDPPVEIPPQQPVKPKPVVEAADPDNPDSLMKHYTAAIAGQNADVLKTFKRQAIGYIKWAHNGEYMDQYDPLDIRVIQRAKTFEQVEEVLKRYDTEPTFLAMVKAGYF